MEALCQQVPCIDAAHCKVLEKALSAKPNYWWSEPSTGRRIGRKESVGPDYFIDPNRLRFDVVFDGDGEVSAERVTEQYLYLDISTFQSLKKASHQAIKVFARQLGCKNTSLSMSMTLAQHYRLAKDTSSKAIPWHRDSADHSLVCLLSDQREWSGGTFHFRRNCEDTVEKYKPLQGSAVIFNNQNTSHSLDPWTARCDNVSRTILTLHAYSKTD